MGGHPSPFWRVLIKTLLLFVMNQMFHWNLFQPTYPLRVRESDVIFLVDSPARSRHVEFFLSPFHLPPNSPFSSGWMDSTHQKPHQGQATLLLATTTRITTQSSLYPPLLPFFMFANWTLYSTTPF